MLTSCIFSILISNIFGLLQDFVGVVSSGVQASGYVLQDFVVCAMEKRTIDG